MFIKVDTVCPGKITSTETTVLINSTANRSLLWTSDGTKIMYWDDYERILLVRWLLRDEVRRVEKVFFFGGLMIMSERGKSLLFCGSPRKIGIHYCSKIELWAGESRVIWLGKYYGLGRSTAIWWWNGMDVRTYKLRFFFLCHMYIEWLFVLYIRWHTKSYSILSLQTRQHVCTFM